MRLGGHPNKGHCAVQAEKVNEGIKVVLDCNCVDYQVQAPSVRTHLIRIARQHYLVRPKSESILSFALRGRESNNVSAQRVSNLDPHVPKTADADDANV